MRDGLLATRAEARAAHQAQSHAVDHHDAGDGGHNVGAHGALRAVPIAFAGSAQALAGAEAGNGRSIERLHGALLRPKADDLGRQCAHTPLKGGFKELIDQEVAALERPFTTMPAPTQMQHPGVDGTGQRAARGQQLAGHHHDQDDAEKIIGAGGHQQQQVVNRPSRQIDWGSGGLFGRSVLGLHTTKTSTN